MSKYGIIPRLAPEGDWNDPMLPNLTVDEHVPVRTGLLDDKGNAIYRFPDPIGFHSTKSPL